MVTSSAWLNDLRNQIEQTRILSTVYRSASALGSCLPSIASARARVVGVAAGAGSILRPVSNGTQVCFPPVQPEVGIFLTPRSLYGKLRLSQMMISEHYMPIYKRNIERVNGQLEKDTAIEACPLDEAAS